MIDGERVVLTPLTGAHREALAAMFRQPEVARWWPGDNVARLDEMLAGNGESRGFVVLSGDELIGFIQYFEEDDPNYRYAAIDVLLRPEWCNQGLGTDALRALARYLIEDRGHHRITIDPCATNGRAIASYRKVGFQDVGVMRGYELGNDGVWHDSLLMDLLAGELT